MAYKLKDQPQIVEEGEESDDQDIAFMTMDFRDVNFQEDTSGNDNLISETLGSFDALKLLQSLEKRILIDNVHNSNESDNDLEHNIDEALTQLEELGVPQTGLKRIRKLCFLLSQGQYAEILRCESISTILNEALEAFKSGQINIKQALYPKIVSFCSSSLLACFELEIVAAAALNLFLQLNYTGPTISFNELADIHPHSPIQEMLQHHVVSSDDQQSKEEKKQNQSECDLWRTNKFHNPILMELSVDGDLPCSVCEGPYFLLLSRIIFHVIADPKHLDWSHAIVSGQFEKEATDAAAMVSLAPCSTTKRERQVWNYPLKNAMVACAMHLQFAALWSARAIVAHQRLLLRTDPSETLWLEARDMFQHCHKLHISREDSKMRERGSLSARVMLEWGLAQHYFDRKGKGKQSFERAKDLSGLVMEVTGAMGLRTKFQTKHTAQLIVRAKSQNAREIVTGIIKEDKDVDNSNQSDSASKSLPQKIEHSEEELLREHIKFQSEDDYEKTHLHVLDQAILLALCLDVKNKNPMDGLTAEEMSAFLERVLLDHDDWMIYSTALLERAWLECESIHGRERALLQIQALVDQHTQRLTLTQSTFKSVEEHSAPAQDRLRNIHSLVYPPRWEIKADLATKYAKMGIVSTAAELFEEVEMWDEVVECYQRCGKESKAEEVVRYRLEKGETPRMWAALGDITKDIKYYEKAVKLSQGKFSSAYIALGKFYFEKKELEKSREYIEKALELKPINPGIWFFFGTLNMRLERWGAALQAFSEVVQQEPEEGEAWANVAAIHMRHNEQAKALPALVEALRYKRDSWRIWWSKLFVCLDLEKVNESVQACNRLLDLRSKQTDSSKIPELDERCVKGIVGQSLGDLEKAIESGNKAAIDSAERTVKRVEDLLERLRDTMSHPWLFETCAYFNDRRGNGILAHEDLMKQYRSLTGLTGWERDIDKIKKSCKVALIICKMNQKSGSKERFSKSKLMLRTLIKKVESCYDTNNLILPEEFANVKALYDELEESVRVTQTI